MWNLHLYANIAAKRSMVVITTFSKHGCLQYHILLFLPKATTNRSETTQVNVYLDHNKSFLLSSTLLKLIQQTPPDVESALICEYS
jgi:hypothetical protein